jgi:hypothetical protein
VPCRGGGTRVLPTGSVLNMSNQYSAGPQQVRITAGTAVKIGFFGALGAVLFSLILSIVLAIVALVLEAAGLGIFQNLGLS